MMPLSLFQHFVPQHQPSYLPLVFTTEGIYLYSMPYIMAWLIGILKCKNGDIPARIMLCQMIYALLWEADAISVRLIRRETWYQYQKRMLIFHNTSNTGKYSISTGESCAMIHTIFPVPAILSIK